MKNIPNVYVGVDISKLSLDIYLTPIGKTYKIGNTRNEIINFIDGLGKYNIVKIGCEATGGYEQLLTLLLREHNYKPWVIDPRRVRGFIVASGCRSKTDKIDAQKIAEFVSKNSPSFEIIQKTEAHAMLQALINRKDDLTKFLAAEKARIKHPAHQFCKSNIEQFVKILEHEIELLDLEIQRVVKENPELRDKANILASIPGIGVASAALLVAYLPELGKISGPQISALVGVCPYNNESGKYNGKRFIKGGRPVPRRALYMCALSGVQFNPDLKRYYERLKESEKPFKVAIVAVMHKLILIANALIKKSEFYDASRIKEDN